MNVVNYVNTVQDYGRALKDTRLGQLRPATEFFDWRRVSKPADSSEYMKRAGYNIRYFSANYAIIVAFLGVYSLVTNPLLLLSLVFLIGGFIAIGRFVPEGGIEISDKVITVQNLYTGLFVLGLPVLWYAAPLSTIFWLIGSSGCVIGAHAGLLEPGVESEYEGVETV